MNNFQEDLNFSNSASEEKFWHEIYKKAFPNIQGYIQCRDNGQGQKLGIDRIIYLTNGSILRIDEKKRRESWNDILIEYGNLYKKDNSFLNDGWINKDLLIDYLAYAFLPLKRVYLLDWLILKKVWQTNKMIWYNKATNKESGFVLVSAENENYTTWSIAVPIETLLKELNNSRTIQLS